MNNRIPVFKTLSEATKLILSKIHLFYKNLIVPMALLLSLEIVTVYYFSGLTSETFKWKPWFAPLVLAAIMLPIIIANICYRITINNQSGHAGWKMTETKSFLKAFQLLLLLIVPLIVCSIISGISYIFFGFSGDEAAHKQVTGLNYIYEFLLMAPFMLIVSYFAARFVCVFPATAIGEKMKFWSSWKITKGNGWRIVMLVLLPSIPLYFLNFIAACFSIENIIVQIAQLPITLIATILVHTSIGMVYQELRVAQSLS